MTGSDTSDGIHPDESGCVKITAELATRVPTAATGEPPAGGVLILKLAS